MPLRCISCIFRAFQTCISRSGWMSWVIPVNSFFSELPSTTLNSGFSNSLISSELLGKEFNLCRRSSTSLLSPAFTRILEEMFWIWSTLSPIPKRFSLSLFPCSGSCRNKCANSIFSGSILCWRSLFLFLWVVERIREAAPWILCLPPAVWMCTCKMLGWKRF